MTTTLQSYTPTFTSRRAALPDYRTRAVDSRAFADTVDIKRDFGTLKSSSSKTASGTASKSDSVFYKFNLDKRGRVRLELENERNFNPFTDLLKQPSLVASVLDDRGRSLKSFDKVGPDKTKSFRSDRLDEGTYYLKVTVSGSKRSVDYSLKLRRASSGLFGSIFD